VTGSIQYEQLSEALVAFGRDDIAGFVYDVKQKFEPGTARRRFLATFLGPAFAASHVQHL